MKQKNFIVAVKIDKKANENQAILVFSFKTKEDYTLFIKDLKAKYPTSQFLIGKAMYEL